MKLGNGYLVAAQLKLSNSPSTRIDTTGHFLHSKTMIPSIVSSLLLLVVTSSTANAQNYTTAPDPLLVGTWSSKSRAVITGPVCVSSAEEASKEKEAKVWLLVLTDSGRTFTIQP